MTFNDIIHELRTSAGVPKEALRAGVAEAVEMRPRIDALAAKLADGVWLVPEDEQLLFYGLHVLAASRDTVIWPRLVDILKLPDADIDRRFGDGAVETLARLILSCHAGAPAELLALVADRQVGWHAKWALFQAIARLAIDSRLDRAVVADTLDRFEREEWADEDSFAWIGWIDGMSHAGLADLEPALRRVWKKRVCAHHTEAERAETLRILAAAAADPGDAHELDRDGICAIDDPVEALRWVERIQETGVGESETTSDPRMGLTEDEVDWLGGFLTSSQVPDTGMGLEMVDGFFSALIAGPDVVRSSAYLDAIWGGVEREAPAFDTKEQAEYVMGLLMRRWNAMAEGIMIGDPAPALIMDFGDTLTGQDWADGFLLGLDYHESLAASGKIEKHTDRLIEPILALAGPEVYGSRILASRREKILDDLPDIILRCAAAWRPNAVTAPTPAPVRSVKVGRNYPCPCGSGKKYKKCCGGSGAGPVLH